LKFYQIELNIKLNIKLNLKFKWHLGSKVRESAPSYFHYIYNITSNSKICRWIKNFKATQALELKFYISVHERVINDVKGSIMQKIAF
jgi:hypothetical protein